MYPDADVARARTVLTKEIGRVPVLADLAQRYGAESTNAIAHEILSTRKAEIDDLVERMGHGSPCHLCKGPRKDNDPFYEFSLAKDIKKKWGGALAMLAVNVVTVPLGVVVGPRGPGLQATLARCRLVMCSSCANRHKNFFGVVHVTQAECSRHPAWNRLIDAGYNRYFDRVKTSQFK